MKRHDLAQIGTSADGGDRSKGFAGDSVEVDAIPAPELRRLVGTAIESHLDPTDLERLLVLEAAERETLADLASTIRDRPGSDG